MRKLLILPIFLLLASFSFKGEDKQATVITIARSGGGANGYNDITETHKDNIHKLVSRNSGWDKADWSIPPILSFCGKSVPEIETAVIKMMESSGLQEGDIAYTRTVVEWKGTKESYTITIREE